MNEKNKLTLKDNELIRVNIMLNNGAVKSELFASEDVEKARMLMNDLDELMDSAQNAKGPACIMVGAFPRIAKINMKAVDMVACEVVRVKENEEDKPALQGIK